jgi:hypothetical protein
MEESQTSLSHAPQSRRRRALRVTLYVAFVSALLGGIAVHRAAAELSERGASLGRGLQQFADLTGRTTRLSFNGAAFSVSTKVIDAPVKGALERFVAHCNSDTHELAGDFERELGPSLGMTQSFAQRLLVMRDVLDNGAATAVCLGGLGEGGLSGLTERFKSFASSGDVSELGQLRYAYMHGAGNRTHVILVSGQGPLHLGELFPSDGRDVPGPEVVPGVRPANSSRVLAAAAAGTPHIMNAYLVKATADAAISDYGGKLEAAGYKPTWIPSGHGTHFEVAQDGSYARAYVLGTHTVITTSKPEDDGGSVLAVAQLEHQLAGEADEHR